MSKEEKTTTVAPTVLTEKVAAFKLIARNSLRMKLISARLSKVAGLEDDLKTLDEQKEEIDHAIKVENYEISKLDTEHPDFEDTKKSKTELVTEYTEDLKDLAEKIEETNKLLTEQKEAIAKIESGETKVCLDSLNDLVSEMVRQSAIVKVD